MTDPIPTTNEYGHPRPNGYGITELLEGGRQPFPDMDEERFASLLASIRRSGKHLTDPVKLSADGILYDGHQRLKALLRLGRKRVTVDEVRIHNEVDHRNAMDHAITANTTRRDTTQEMRVQIAKERLAEGWSMGRIAAAFKVSRPAVSKWLRDVADKPQVVLGADNVMRPVSPSALASALTPARPAGRRGPVVADELAAWDPHGGEVTIARQKVMHAIGALLRAMETPVDVTDENQRALIRQGMDHLAQRATALAEAVRDFVEHLDAVVPTEDLSPDGGA